MKDPNVINKWYAYAFVGELDSTNQLVWSRRYLNTTGYSAQLRSLQPGVDSGFIMMGQTVNPVEETWVYRLGRTGDSVWKKYYGGSGRDVGTYVSRVSDNGYIFIGTSTSSDGTLSGVRTSDPATQGKVWVCRLDNSGSVLWTKCFGYAGGTSDEGVIIKPTLDGGFICGANMESPGYGSTTYHGGVDIWLAKLTSTGDIEWARYYGGSSQELLRDVEETPDGYVFTGGTASNNGDVSGSYGGEDAWIGKISKTGQLTWQRCIGGSGSEELRDVLQAQDNSFVATGTTAWSNDGDIRTNMDSSNILLVKVSSSGALLWVTTFGGSSADYGENILQTGENDYTITGLVQSGNGDFQGMVTNPYGSLWLGKLSRGNTIKGSVFFDTNANGQWDAGEKGANNLPVTAAKAGKQYSTNVKDGAFLMAVDTGSYTISTKSLEYYTLVPSSTTKTYTTFFNQDSIGFALQPAPSKQDLRVTATALNTARPGFSVDYLLYYQNKGTTIIPQVQVLFAFNKKLQFTSASPQNSSGADTLKWDLAGLQPGDTGTIRLSFGVKTPPTANINDTLVSLALITPVAGDETPSDDSAYLRQVIRGSYDPNDKAETHGGVITHAKILQGSYLDYTIRFQNTGTDTAFTVVVRDTLGSEVDWTTLEMVAASHPYTMQVQDGSKIAWTFSNILLPDNKTNEWASHGYLWYRVKAKTTLAPGDVVHNDASIYFDYNLPVVTNDALTLVQDIGTPLPITLLDFTGHLQGRRAQLRWTTAGAFNFDRFEVERSLDARSFTKVGERPLSPSNAYSFDDDLSALQTEMVFYRLRMIDIDNRYTYSRVLPIRLGELDGGLRVYPNPSARDAWLSYSAVADGKATLRITDLSGRVVVQQTIAVQKDSNVISIHGFTNLLPGQYVVQVVQEGRSLQSRLVVQ